jgi:membrane protease YdiL (CAAX protease family)
MSTPENTEIRTVPPTVLVHQEGVIAAIALIGLAMRDGIPAGLAAGGAPLTAVFLGLVAGVGGFVLMWVLRVFRPMRELERWQRQMVAGWSATDAVVIALFSGLAEEALIRALLQPIIGLVPAAMVFAVLHIVPDRRVWLWPVLALVLGLGLGWVFEYGGYPAAATAHIVINLLSLLRLREAAAS